MKRVLVVSFFFPPINAVGSVRHDRFARYLPDHGWQPQVLTVDRFTTRPATMASDLDSQHITRAWFPDAVGLGIRAMRPASSGSSPSPTPTPATAAGAIPPRAWGRLRSRVYSAIKNSLPVDVVRMPDRALPWVLPAVAAGLRLLETGQFDVILSTSPPPSTNLVASLLCRLSGVPWVADFRDLWTQNHSFQRAAPWQGWEEHIERRVLAPADRLITVSEPLAERLRRLHGKPVSVVTNGYDDPPALPEASAPARDTAQAGGRLLLTYTGSLYPVMQDPAPLFKAVTMVRARRKVSGEDLEIRFLGSDREYLAPLIAHHGLEDMVTVPDPVPQPEAIAMQYASTALLFVTWADAAYDGLYSLKVFEYLAAGKPILGVGPTGTVVDKLLRNCELGRVLNDPTQIAAQLETWLDELAHQNHLTIQGNQPKIQRYHVRNLSARLATILDNTKR